MLLETNEVNNNRLCQYTPTQTVLNVIIWIVGYITMVTTHAYKTRHEVQTNTCDFTWHVHTPSQTAPHFQENKYSENAKSRKALASIYIYVTFRGFGPSQQRTVTFNSKIYSRISVYGEHLPDRGINTNECQDNTK